MKHFLSITLLWTLCLSFVKAYSHDTFLPTFSANSQKHKCMLRDSVSPKEQKFKRWELGVSSGLNYSDPQGESWGFDNYKITAKQGNSIGLSLGCKIFKNTCLQFNSSYDVLKNSYINHQTLSLNDFFKYTQRFDLLNFNLMIQQKVQYKRVILFVGAGYQQVFLKGNTKTTTYIPDPKFSFKRSLFSNDKVINGFNSEIGVQFEISKAIKISFIYQHFKPFKPFIEEYESPWGRGLNLYQPIYDIIKLSLSYSF